ncbi:hypothetical protein E2986_00381 [Frieseomelitta varia]|uniref:Uncharacterized protein n=1 Tax=Frieseomelitta varia TaxID=561572 RepID=A0A833RNQ9_9HYME|nr:hypothetical protein E2986_00381 [Frieseomelitta varia]
MVYESDFYTTRRPYSRPLVSSYSVTKQDYFPWEKVPFVPRPSLVPDPFTVWGRKKQDPKKEFYQYVTLKDKEGVVRGKNPAKEDHARQLVDGGAVSKTPRHYVVRDYPEVGVRAAQEQYSYAYTNTSSSSSSSATDPYSRRPQRTSHTEESVVKRESGPYGSYSTERSYRTSTGGGPGGYRSSYESHTSGRLPGGTTYRHFSYRV